MKRYFVILAAGGLAACSSSSSNGSTPPPPTNYSYNGTPAAATSAQSVAATDVGTTTGSVAVAATSGSVQQNAQTLTTAPEIPLTVSSDLGGDSVAFPKSPAGKSATAMVNKVLKMTKSGQLDASGCNYTVSGNTITYNNCDITDSEDDETITINGSLTETTSGSTTTLTWNIQITFNLSASSDGSSFSESFTGNETGNMTFTTTGDTTTTIGGTATIGLSVTFNSSGDNGQFAYTAQVVWNSAEYDTSCNYGAFVGGSIDVSVTVAGTENGQAIEGYNDFGFQFDFGVCNSPVQVITGST